jgi:hypothetical protein
VNSDRLVGSVGVRLATLLFLLLSVTVVVLYKHGSFPNVSKALLIVAVVAGILAFIGVIHSIRTVYTAWLNLAMTLNTVMITILFGACYLLVVPVFFAIRWPSDPLGVRKRSEVETFWIRRRRSRCDLASLQRLG